MKGPDGRLGEDEVEAFQTGIQEDSDEDDYESESDIQWDEMTGKTATTTTLFYWWMAPPPPELIPSRCPETVWWGLKSRRKAAALAEAEMRAAALAKDFKSKFLLSEPEKATSGDELEEFVESSRQASLDVMGTTSVALIGLFAGGGVAIAMLRCRDGARVMGEKPLLAI
eukprot:gnl/TRDRNA2_/TRDRNA2_138404_c0_seq1.p1 gnl/TRDRNA2_/TRDRNA2_138404_c0~~gnl/TRDRNA2_/TRDRNA2_138404_c0_seq1.p1  ORF type:complete len:170 (-),score=39.58 gnl/TRDRNA2_/TRDRNA2_138404_c0_seq1:308-817(-)